MIVTSVGWTILTIGVTLFSFVAYLYGVMHGKRHSMDTAIDTLEIAAASVAITRDHLNSYYDWVDTELSGNILLLLKHNPIVETFARAAQYDETKLMKALEPVVVEIEKLMLQKLAGTLKEMENQKVQVLAKRLDELKRQP